MSFSNDSMTIGDIKNRDRETDPHRFHIVAVEKAFEDLLVSPSPPFRLLRLDTRVLLFKLELAPIANEHVRTNSASGLAARPKFSKVL